MPKTLLCFLLLLALTSLIAQEFKIPIAKEALVKCKAECKKSVGILTSVEVQGIKNLNVALSKTILLLSTKKI